MDGDGVVDMAVGAWLDDDGGSNRGAAYVLFMHSDGTVKKQQKISDQEVMRQCCLAPCRSPSAIAPSLISVAVALPPFVCLTTANC